MLFSGTLLDPPAPVAGLAPDGDDDDAAGLLNGEMSLLSVLGFAGSAESKLESLAADFAGVDEAGALSPGPDMVSDAVAGARRSEPASVAAGLAAVEGGM